MCIKTHSNHNNNTTRPFVTDEEAGIVNAVQTVLPNTPRFRCWNHTIRDSKRFLHAHGAPSVYVSVYLNDLRTLLHEIKNNIKLEEWKKWSSAYLDYLIFDIQYPLLGQVDD